MSKGKGWHGESKRHALARLGIKTKIQDSFNTPLRMPTKNERTQNVAQQVERKQQTDTKFKNEITRSTRHRQITQRRQNPKSIRTRTTNDTKDLRGQEQINIMLEALKQQKIEQPTGMTEDTYNVKFDKQDTGFKDYNTAIRHPTDPRRKYNIQLEYLDIDSAIRRQYSIFQKRYGGSGANEFWKSTSKEKINEYAEKIKNGEYMPPMVLEYDEKGNIVPIPGDINLLAAIKTRWPDTEVPVYIMKRRTEEDIIRDTYGERSEEFTEYMREKE